MQGTSGQALAESIVLRGARQRGAPLQAAQAGDLLDQSLLLEGAADTLSTTKWTCCASACWSKGCSSNTGVAVCALCMLLTLSYSGLSAG